MSATVFENAMVFDGESPRVTGPCSVLVEANEIMDIVRGCVRVDGAERIDCSGGVLMPGMIDLHSHIYAESIDSTLPEPPITYRAQYARNFLSHMLSCGFTGVRDVGGGDHGMAMALRDGFLRGPRFFYGGLCLTQTGGHGDFRSRAQATDYVSCGARRNFFAIHADGVDECIKAVREELRKGAAHIKIMASGGVLSPSDPLDRCQYSEAEIRAIVEECNRHGTYVCAHCHPAEAIRRCVKYGVRSIEHGTLIDDATAGLVAKTGAYVVPTMAVIVALVQDGAAMGMTEESRSKLLKVSDHSLRGLEIMRREGVKMGFGTDLLGPQHTRHGSEFSIRSQALSAFEILHSATALGGEILQMKGRLGVVRPGALADLLVVDGNPLDDIGLLVEDGRHISHIMLDGALVKHPPAGPGMVP